MLSRGYPRWNPSSFLMLNNRHSADWFIVRLIVQNGLKRLVSVFLRLVQQPEWTTAARYFGFAWFVDQPPGRDEPGEILRVSRYCQDSHGTNMRITAREAAYGRV